MNGEWKPVWVITVPAAWHRPQSLCAEDKLCP